MALIDGIETSGKLHSLITKLYIRYGELDPEGALERIGGDPPVIWRDSLKLAMLCCALQGWARVEPKKAWDYFERWRLEDGSNVLRNAGEASDVPYEVFGAWVEQDSEAAFANLLNVHPKELQRAGQGYYFSLPRDSDFHSEARSLEHLIDHKKQRNELWLSTDKGETLYWWRLTLCTKWADRDADSATEWWLSMDDYAKRDSNATAERQQQRRAYWMGLHVGNWAGHWHKSRHENNADGAVGWILDNPHWFQERPFRDQVLPTIARHRPLDAIELIKRIESTQEQSYQLSLLVRPPTFSGEGRYRRMDPSGILDPDTVESQLASLELSGDDLQRVKATLAKRREFEANQPAPQPSTW